MLLMILAYTLAAVALLFYLYSKWVFSYWKRRGLEYVEPKWMESPGVKIFNAYHYFKTKGAKQGGIYLFLKPVYIPADLEIVKNILQNDFNHFVNRGAIQITQPIVNHLFNMEDDEWRNMRTKLTPTFTSGKMKMMFQTMLEKSVILIDVLKELAVINDPVDIKEIISRFTTDIIGSTSFGIECNSLRTPNSEFRTFGKKMLARIGRVFFISALPASLLKFFNYKIMPEDLESYFLNIVKSTVDYREKNNVYRKDFMHLLLELKHKGKVSDTNDEKILFDKDNKGEHLSLVEMAAQCLVFFIAGFETSATTMTFAILELSQNQDIQDKLRKEIKDILKETNGQFTYEAIMKMEYLDKVVNETLRKFPPAQIIPRKCNKDYPVPGTDFVIKKGQHLMMPYRAIHHDPEHWPNPEKFDPERFNKENKATRHKYAFLPFGEGPRMCIGARFGLLQAKIGLASVINNFKVSINKKTTFPIEINYTGFIQATKKVIWFNIEKVD